MLPAGRAGAVGPDVLPGVQGEVTCDGAINVVDSLFILQFDVGLRMGSDDCPPPSDALYLPACDVTTADVDCNVVDALFILQCDVGVLNAFCPSRSPVLGSPGDQTVELGSSLHLTLLATDPEDDPLVFGALPLPLPPNASFDSVTSMSWPWRL